MGMCVATDGTFLSDNVIKDIVLNGDFKEAYFTICKYVTKRELLPLHLKIIKQQSEDKRSLHLAPRGHGKSTVGDVDFSIVHILRNPNIRIMIGSKTQMQAEAFLKEIRTHFEMNIDLLRIFGNMRSELWNNSEFRVKNRQKILKEATVTALGSSGAVVSKHFDIIIGDDLVGFENARTEVQRNKLKEWFYSSLLPTLEPEGSIHILGTRYHPLDLYEDFINSGKYQVVIQRALTPYDDEKPLHRKYKAMNHIPFDTKNGDEFSLWESKFSKKILKDIQGESGLIIFGMQYQNDTELAKGNIFKPQYFQYFLEHRIDYNNDKVFIKINTENGVEEKRVIPYIGVDLAISQKTSADYFSLFVIGVDSDNNIYCLEYVKDRMSFDKQLNTIIMYGETKYPMCTRIGVESVAYQEAMLQELRRNSSLPIIGIHTSKDKVTRATRRSALFETYKVYFNQNMKEFEEMLLLFPEVKNDDLFDSWEFAVTVAEKKGGAKVRDRENFYV